MGINLFSRQMRTSFLPPPPPPPSVPFTPSAQECGTTSSHESGKISGNAKETHEMERQQYFLYNIACHVTLETQALILARHLQRMKLRKGEEDSEMCPSFLCPSRKYRAEHESLQVARSRIGCSLVSKMLRHLKTVNFITFCAVRPCRSEARTVVVVVSLPSSAKAPPTIPRCCSSSAKVRNEEN